jgi:5-(carboxyamino)imidazole ribonucleotide synthase
MALPPGATLGILGNGQLGQMMAHAAVAMGFRVHVYGPEEGAPATFATPLSTTGSYDDAAALAAFAGSVDVITYEFENVPLVAINAVLDAGVAVYPSRDVLAICQHRIREKEALAAMGIPTAPYAPVWCEDDLSHAATHVGFPCILKTAESGYDGKGQRMVRDMPALHAAWAEFGGVACVAEAVVAFDMEISVIVARDIHGDTACYDAVHNIHRHHILDETHVPAPLPVSILEQAQALALRIAEGMGLRGLMAVEIFVERDGTLRVNELAPRPHNSGHWTMEACATSQFTQCVRAVMGLPLASTTRHSNAVMKNLIGCASHAWPNEVQDANASIHWYGKASAADGRKMGHITWLSPRQ